jgi:mitogen-activated protein kinase kinase kinase
LLDDKYLNVFLEYIPGGSVATLLRNYGAFEEPLVRDFVRQILEGLNYLHERDIIHCDINGANILVDNTGGIKICSFGISKKVGDSSACEADLFFQVVLIPPQDLLTSNHMHSPLLQGSAFCMAPEVVKQGTYTLKADIWSVGCLAVEMLTGEHSWAPLTQMQAIFKVRFTRPPSLPHRVCLPRRTSTDRVLRKTHHPIGYLERCPGLFDAHL